MLELIIVVSLLVVVATTPLPVDASVMQSWASYGTVLGLAGAGTKWKRSMEQNAQQLAKQSAQAIAWQESATADETTADEVQAAAVADEEESAALLSEGEALEAKGHADEAKALTEIEEADAMAVQASEVEAQAEELFAEAGAAEITAAEESAMATATAALAAEHNAIAETDEVATAACNAIPVLDVICDVVGGLAAAALESQSVREAAAAVEEFAASATAHAEAETLVGEGTELVAVSAAEKEESSVLSGQAAELQAQASEELADAKAEEAAAEERMAKGTAEEEEAVELQAKAAGEENESTNAWRKAEEYGALTLRDGIVSVALGFAALMFFGLRIVASWICPAVQWVACSTIRLLFRRQDEDPLTDRLGNPTSTNVLWNVSHCFHHLGFSVVALGWYGTMVTSLPLLSIRTVGGVFLCFAITVAVMHSLLFCISKACGHYRESHERLWALWIGCRELMRRILFILPLVLLELLFLWINFGRPSEYVIILSQNIIVRAVIGMSVLLHICYFVLSSPETASQREKIQEATSDVIDPAACRLLLEKNHGDVPTTVVYGTNEPMSHVDDDDSLCDASEVLEMQQLLVSEFEMSPSELAPTPSTDATIEKQTHFHIQVWNDWKLLLLPFELVMVSVMFALVRQSVPTMVKLWPSSKALLIASIPSSFVVGTLVIAILLLLAALCYCHTRSLAENC